MNKSELLNLGLAFLLTSNACQQPDQLPSGFSWTTCPNIGLKLPKPDGYFVHTESGINLEACFVTKEKITSANDQFKTGFSINALKGLSDPVRTIAKPFNLPYPGAYIDNRQSFTKENMLIHRQNFKVYANLRGVRTYDDTFLTMFAATNDVHRTTYIASFETPITEYNENPEVVKVMTDINNLKFNPKY